MMEKYLSGADFKPLLDTLGQMATLRYRDGRCVQVRAAIQPRQNLTRYGGDGLMGGADGLGHTDNRQYVYYGPAEHSLDTVQSIETAAGLYYPVCADQVYAGNRALYIRAVLHPASAQP